MSHYLIIEVTPKLWRPKVTNCSRTPELDDNGVTGILFQYGKYVYKSELEWSSGTKREDLIFVKYAAHTTELNKDLSFNSTVNATIITEIMNIIKEFWDFFLKEGTKRLILGYEFGIDTIDSKSVCCRKPSYSPYGATFFLSQVNYLFNKGWIDHTKLLGELWSSLFKNITRITLQR